MVTTLFVSLVGEMTLILGVIDDEGFLYVAAEYERATTRSQEVGQLVKRPVET